MMLNQNENKPKRRDARGLQLAINQSAQQILLTTRMSGLNAAKVNSNCAIPEIPEIC